MKNSRSAFKEALKQCKKNKFNEICQSIEEKYKSKDFSKFWKEVKQKKCMEKKSDIIDGTKDQNKILQLFTDKFLGNSLNTHENPDRGEAILISNLKEKWISCRKYNLVISASRIRKLCKQLNKGMGYDGLHTTFLNQASDKF